MLPKMKRPSGIGKTVQVDFGGYDRRPDARDGTFGQTEGMSQREYPVISTDQKNYTLSGEGPLELCLLSAGKRLLWVEDGSVYCDGAFLGTMRAQPSRRLVAFGNQAIFPETRERIDLRVIPKGIVNYEAELPRSGSAADGDGWLVRFETMETAYEQPHLFVFDAETRSWTDSGPMIRSLEASITVEAFIRDGLYQGEQAEMNTILTYGDIADVDFTKLFRPGDALTISGCVMEPSNNQTIIVREVLPDTLRFYEHSFRKQGAIVCFAEEALDIWPNAGYMPIGEGVEDWPNIGFSDQVQVGFAVVLYTAPEDGKQIVRVYDPSDWSLQQQLALDALPPGWDSELTVTPLRFQRMAAEETGIPKDPIYEGSITITRKWPEGLTGLFADNNRLWGWTGRTLRASRLGDASNWDFFDGTAEDSWAVELLRQEQITGGISAHGYPTFFTESRRIRVYGGSPESYQTSELDCVGVREGCERSLTVVDGALYYVSREGVMRDDGSVPVCVSEAFGTMRLRNAVAGGVGTLLLLSGTDDADEGHLFSFDTRSGVWIRMGGRQFTDFAAADGRLFGAVWEPGEQSNDETRMVAFGSAPDWGSWEAYGDGSFTLETNDYTLTQPNSKRVHRIQLRMLLEEGTRLTVAVLYDGGEDWVVVARLAGEGRRRSVYLPIMPRRCDHFRFRFSGTGAWRLESLALETRSGSPELDQGRRFTE